MITVTEGAKEHLKNIAIDNSKTPKLGVRGGGCAGFSYDWGLVSDDEVLKDDETIYFYINNIKFFICHHINFIF